MSGGGTSGSVTLEADTTYLQRRVTGYCPDNYFLRRIYAEGSTVLCGLDNVGPILPHSDSVNSTGALFTIANAGSGAGIVGRSGNATASTSYGVGGTNTTTGSFGTLGYNRYGVYGYQSSNASSTHAGYFAGDVRVTGSLINAATRSMIDHPLDPQNKYLTLAAVESSVRLTVYTGNVTLDVNGEAWVEMPDWFEALNGDFRYQLTAIGAPGPNLYIAEKIAGNRFKIAGGAPNMEVSWQVTAERQDAYAMANPLTVETEKPLEEKGLYANPEAFGLTRAEGLQTLQPQPIEGGVQP